MKIFDWLMVWTIILLIGYKLGYVARITSIFIPLMVVVGVGIISIVMESRKKD